MERWHDFYVAAGGAAAVLLGLLFAPRLERRGRPPHDLEFVHAVAPEGQPEAQR